MDDFETSDDCKRVVDCAEAAAQRAATSERKGDFRTQLSQLISVCQEATCQEQVENYIRYQIGRRQWPRDVGDEVLRQAKIALDPLPVSGRTRGWTHFATYLKRAFVYRALVGSTQ